MRIVQIGTMTIASPNSGYKTRERRKVDVKGKKEYRDVWGIRGYMRGIASKGLDPDKIYQVELNWTSPPGTNTEDTWVTSDDLFNPDAWGEYVETARTHAKAQAWACIRPKRGKDHECDEPDNCQLVGTHACDESDNCRELCSYLEEVNWDLNDFEEAMALIAYFEHFNTNTTKATTELNCCLGCGSNEYPHRCENV